MTDSEKTNDIPLGLIAIIQETLSRPITIKHKGKQVTFQHDFSLGESLDELIRQPDTEND